VPEIRENKTGKVLSSAQNLKKMEEKEEAKWQEALLKEQRKIERQQR
jgi:hypothetical protein